MITEIIIIWALCIYFSMYFAGQKDMSIKKAFWFSLFFSIFALIFYMMYTPDDYFARFRWAWGGLGFLMLWFFGFIAIFWVLYFYFTHPTII